MKKTYRQILSGVISCTLLLGNLTFVKAAESSLENVAFNKTVLASSGSFSEAWGISGAIDGDLNKGWSGGTGVPAENPIALKPGEANGIIIDLEEMCLVSEICVRTRRDIDAQWDRRGWSVYVSTDPEFKTEELVGTKKLAGAFGEDLEIKLPSTKKIRYIKVVSTTALTLAEIEAYGIPIGSGSGFAEYSDMESSNASNLLSYLGIIDTSTEYNPLTLVTRGQAAEYVLKLANVSVLSDKIYFQDVPSEHKYAKEIGACLEKGFISQAENFRPDDFISEYEFLVMIMRVLGYDKTADVNIADKQSVISKAHILELLNNTSFNGETNVNKENIMWIMFNALNTYVTKFKSGINDGYATVDYDDAETLLEKAHKTTLKSGIVEENNETTLNSEKLSSKTHIRIGGEDYYDESEALYAYIGQRIVFGVDTGDDTLIKFGYGDFEKNKVIQIDCNDLENVTSGEISYAVNNKTKRIKLNDAKILKNYKAFSDYRMELEFFNAADGYLELTDNNNDGKYEIVNIMEPIVVEKEGISFTEGLTVTQKGGQRYIFDDYDNIDLFANGREASEKSLLNSNFLLIYATEGRKNIRIEGFSTSHTGIIESVIDDYVVIDGEKYKFSDYYISNKNKYPELTPGEERTVYHAKGKIFIVDTSEAQGVIQTGFVLRTGTDEDDTTVSFRIFKMNGEFCDAYSGKRLYVDGKTWNSTELVNNRRYFEKKFMQFKMTADNKLTWVDTEEYNSNTEPLSTMKKVEEVTGACRKSIDGLWSGYSFVAPMNAEAPMFMIPTINGEYATSSSYEKYYAMSQFSHVYGYNGKSVDETDSFYNKDENGYVTFGASCRLIPISKKEYAPCADATATMVIVDKISTALDAEGELVWKVSGFSIPKGAKVEMLVPSEFKYAVNVPAIINAGATAYYNSSYNTAKRDIDIPNEYLMPLSSIKAGAVLRIQMLDNLALGIDVIDDMQSGQNMVYSSYNNIGTIYSGVLAMHAKFKSISDGILTYDAGYGNTIKKYSEFQNMFVIDGSTVEKVSITELPKYYSDNKDIFMLFNSGKAMSLVLRN